MDFETANELLRYEAKTGKLFYRKRDIKWFMNSKNPLRMMNMWNTKYAGKEAFTLIRRDGYKTGSLLHKKYYCHRIVFLLHHGRFPAGETDHLNGIKTDNRIENLRETTKTINMRNMKMLSTNKTGYTGVSWCRKTQKYRVRIQIDGKTTVLGYFDSPEEGYKVRRQAEKDMGGYTDRHGT